MSTTLNAICPYFTMFPLAFPLGILQRHSGQGDAVLDPFAGRGTTLYAARLRGLPAYGIDSNPVAATISQAKLVNTTPQRILDSTRRILREIKEPQDVPTGAFWDLAFHRDVLLTICRLREGLLPEPRSHDDVALRAILLGALHGPLTKTNQSYLSNQCPRTFAPKPRYAVKFWQEHHLAPPRVDVIQVIERRALRFFADEHTLAVGRAIHGDSQDPASFRLPTAVSWIITSPPYYGMRTYLPDQWLRAWFLGGPPEVDYSVAGQLPHSSQQAFADGLRSVWDNCAAVASTGCRMVVRFGAINDRKVDALGLAKDSFRYTPWTVRTCRRAGSARLGKRQADHFVRAASPIEEYDIWAQLNQRPVSRRSTSRPPAETTESPVTR